MQDGWFTFSEMECMGSCVNAPMIAVADYTKGSDGFTYIYYEDLSPADAVKILDDLKAGREPRVRSLVLSSYQSHLKSLLPTSTAIDHFKGSYHLQWLSKIVKFFSGHHWQLQSLRVQMHSIVNAKSFEAWDEVANTAGILASSRFYCLSPGIEQCICEFLYTLECCMFSGPKRCLNSRSLKPCVNFALWFCREAHNTVTKRSLLGVWVVGNGSRNKRVQSPWPLRVWAATLQGHSVGI